MEGYSSRSIDESESSDGFGECESGDDSDQSSGDVHPYELFLADLMGGRVYKRSRR